MKSILFPIVTSFVVNRKKASPHYDAPTITCAEDDVQNWFSITISDLMSTKKFSF